MSDNPRKRRHDLSLGDKREIIRMIDNRTSQTYIAKLYKCSQSQISRIASRRDEILSDWANCDDPVQKKSRLSTDIGQSEQDSSYSVKDENDEKVPMVADQSTSPRPPSENTFDETEQQTPEKSNNGWLEYWKRHSSSFSHRTYGDFDVEYWGHQQGSGVKRGQRGRPKPLPGKESRISNQMLDILKNYDVCDVYCADELALHYDAMPSFEGSNNGDGDEADTESDQKDGDITASQKQITVFLTSNVTGSDKRDFLVIEDSKQSDAEVMESKISGCQRAKAPHAWMTSDIYTDYLVALEYDMRRQQRYILLLVDNAPPHDPHAGQSLEHVRVLYMRSYTTPFFHGLFYSVRAHYRKQILLKLVASSAQRTGKDSSTGRMKLGRSGPHLSVDINFEEAVNMLKLAWQSVSPQEVVQCFSKSGLCAPHIHGLPESRGDDLPELPDGFVTDEQYEDFVNIDVDAECSGDMDLVSTECSILSDLRQQGFTDVGLEPPDDPAADSADLLANSVVSPGKLHETAMAGGFRLEKRGVLDRSGDVDRSLSTLRSFLKQHSLHLHNLHALEAQIYSCHSGGH